jgi:hypothetical protein
MYEKKEMKTYNRNDDIKNISESFLTNAKLAGSGKTWMLVFLFNSDTDIILLPTHEALQNVLRTAKDQGVYIDEDRIKVIANYFTEDETKILRANQIKGLRRFKNINR